MPRLVLAVLVVVSAACSPGRPNTPQSPAPALQTVVPWTMIPADDLMYPNHDESYRSGPCMVTMRKRGGVTLNTHAGELSQWVDIRPTGNGGTSITRNVTRWEWVRSPSGGMLSIGSVLFAELAPDLFAKYCGKKAENLPEAVKKQFYGYYVTAKG